MSPNAYLSYNKTGLLCGYPGEAEIEEPTFVWSYSIFECINGDPVSPSMYEYFTGYVLSNILKDQLYDIQAEDYCEGDLEEDAVAAYYALPLNDRVNMHLRTLEILRGNLVIADSKETAAMNWVLDHENQPFDPTSPIYGEVVDFVRDLVTKNRERRELLEHQVQEEENWTGGIENDPMEE
jgi:hypothetical protein